MVQYIDPMGASTKVSVTYLHFVMSCFPFDMGSGSLSDLDSEMTLLDLVSRHPSISSEVHQHKRSVNSTKQGAPGQL